MVTGFEDITTDLTAKDMDILQFVLNGLSMCREPRHSEEVCELILQLYWESEETYIPFSSVRLRKFVNFIRAHSLLPIIATSKGYYVAYEQEEIRKQIKSLNERASAITKCANGLKKFIDEDN